jgi:hydroxyethylthiazole kinase-like uncharacterized protein yjeF
VLVVGGSAQTAGAVLLAGEAALRVGAGKLQMATAEGAAAVLAVAVPEGRVLPLPQSPDGVVDVAAADAVVEAARTAAATLLGPGLVDLDAVVALAEKVVPRLATAEGAVVVDALATAYVTAHRDGLRELAGRCVLTVNPVELARVLDRDEDEVSGALARAARDAAACTGSVVLCGGSVKAVADPSGEVWLVGYGGPGLAGSGSGDVQAGIVAGLLARGAAPAQAAVWAAALHGRAGDRLATTVGPLGFLARDLPATLPGLLAQLR